MIEEPKIGKNLIEILTDGMYKNPLFMYREYIQNSADAIDEAVNKKLLQNTREGVIKITIGPGVSIIIQDNGTGIKKSKVLKSLGDIADSEKDRKKSKGFRGIGRLGGVAYAKTLQFITSAKGEASKSIVTIDCMNLRNEIADDKIKDNASKIFAKNTTFSSEKEQKDKRYFIVHLESVSEKSLLDAEKVKTYLSTVSPVPYPAGFHFKKRIREYLRKNNVEFPEYEVFVNDNQIFKPYSSNFYSPKGSSQKITDTVSTIKFEKIYRNNDLIAIMWYSISKLKNKLPLSSNPLAGIRYRQWNIQIGDENNIKHLFKEERGTMFFIGEVICASTDLIANSRRDSFNHNDTFSYLKESINSIAKELTKLYRKANEISNVIKSRTNLEDAIEVYNNAAKKGFKNDGEANKAKRQLEAKNNLVDISLQKLERIKEDDSDQNQIIKSLYQEKIDDFSINNIEKTRKSIIPNKQISITTSAKGINLDAVLSKIKQILHNNMQKTRADEIFEQIRDELS
jgi:molecular chaperone HtpG|tara:strand:+ start:3297 stop:4832 length:1536 start_codon:yes stop_codon:yes gene_type:complete